MLDEGRDFSQLASRIVLTPIRTTSFGEDVTYEGGGCSRRSMHVLTSRIQGWKTRPNLFLFRGRDGQDCKGQQDGRVYVGGCAASRCHLSAKLAFCLLTLRVAVRCVCLTPLCRYLDRVVSKLLKGYNSTIKDSYAREPGKGFSKSVFL